MKLQSALQQVLMNKQSEEPQSKASSPGQLQQATALPAPAQQPVMSKQGQQQSVMTTPPPPQQQSATTAPLPPQQFVQAQIETNALHAMNLKFDGAKPSEGSAKTFQPATQLASDDRLKAAKVALNLK